MSLRKKLKTLAERVPAPVGRIAAAIPFGLRFGPAYSNSYRMAGRVQAYPEDLLRSWILLRLKEIVNHAYATNRFYRTHYQRHGYDPASLVSLEHFQDVPVVTKEVLHEFALEDRSTAHRGSLLINTGGTSGRPLGFHVDRHAFAREWAHMHRIWESGGYHYRHMKLTLRGTNIGKVPLRYNAVHNEWVVNTYMDRNLVFQALRKVLKRNRIGWIHGYPSLVAEFLIDLDKADPGLRRRLQASLNGVLLGSEAPLAHYVESIAGLAHDNIIAWYGHSEMNVLARNTGGQTYVPMHSYGFVEGVRGDAGTRLVGTSYWNVSAPFIRYDTGDFIDADVVGCLMKSFEVTKGRVGDFVLDADGNRISLTSLMFGRHHRAFEKIRHVQVRQRAPGQIELLIVPLQAHDRPEDIMPDFDFSGTGLQATPILIDAPVRTANGKIRLLVS